MNLDKAIDLITMLFGAGGMLTFLLSIRRTKAQNTLDLSSAWEKFAAPLMERLQALETKVTDQETEIEDLRGYVKRLVRQIIELGGTPVEFIKRAHPIKPE